MKDRKSLGAALALVGTALGLDYATGRPAAFFYAQLGAAGWAGIAFSGMVFGGATGLLCALVRRMGVRDIGMLLRSMGCGQLVFGLYMLALGAMGCMLASEAGHIAALALPVRHARLYGTLLALTASAAIALGRGGWMRIPGVFYALALAGFEAALLFFPGKADAALHHGAVLRLENCVPAALALAALHTAVGLCLAAGAAAELAGSGVRPLRLGLLCGGIYAFLLRGGTAVLQASEPAALRLKLPFTALASGWGAAGFWLSAGLVFLGSVCGLTAVLRAMILNINAGISSKNDVKF